MDALIFSLNAVLPLIIMALVGYMLGRVGLIAEGVPNVLNRMVFKLFLPPTLFLNIYRIESFGELDFGYVAYALLTVIVMLALTIPLVFWLSRDSSRRGVMLQAVFRSNYALIGIPLATSLCGEAGAEVAAVLSAFAIPLFNVLAVVTLSLFSDFKGRVSVKRILLDIAKNPLIESIALGFIALGIREILSTGGIEWRITEVVPLFRVLESLSAVATPLALVTLGSQFKFSAVGKMKLELIFSVLARTVAMPVLALSVAYIFFDFRATHYASFVALFATPVAVSSVPMTQEMGGDTELAGQIVVWSTASSALTIFLFTFILKLIGVF